MDWQPIETAPRDGTEVLLFTESTETDTAFELDPFTAVQIGYWEDAVSFPMRVAPAGWRTEKIGEPTHWMPLPPRPSLSEKYLAVLATRLRDPTEDEMERARQRWGNAHKSA